MACVAPIPDLHRRLVRAWLPAVALVVAAACATIGPACAIEEGTSDPTLRHALEDRARHDPQAVLRELPALLAAAQAPRHARERALLLLAKANACRVRAEWACQREAGLAARDAAIEAALPTLEVRGLILASRACMATQDYATAARQLGQAELLLRKVDQPVLAADVDLAYSSMSLALGQFREQAEYAQRGLDRLGPDQAPLVRLRLVRNLVAAKRALGGLGEANAILQHALEAGGRLEDPKLLAELHLEGARLARATGDPRAQRESALRALELGERFDNPFLSGESSEELGLAARDIGDHEGAQAYLQRARELFHSIGRSREELHALRALLELQIELDLPAPVVRPSVRRYLELDRDVVQAERALAAADFDARLKYARQDTELARLEGEATLARERTASLAARNRLSRFLVALVALGLPVLAIFLVLQRRAYRRLRAALRARRESEARAGELLRLSAGYVFLHDLHGQVLLANPAVATALGVATPQLVGRDFREFIADDEQSRFEDYLGHLRSDGHAEGVLRIRRSDGGVRSWRYGNRLSQESTDEAYVLCHAVDVTDQMAEAESLRAKSERDPLTGAWNRRHLAPFERGHGEAHWAVVVFDLDGFKRVNDTHGHEHGDRLLIAFVHFLQQHVRAQDAVVRIGGDEFLLLLADADETALAGLLERLRQAEFESPCAYSMGAALREAGESLAGTCARADASMYESRRLQRSEARRRA